MLKIELLHRMADVEQIASQWSQLAGDRVFTHPMWLLPWYRNFQTLHTRPYVVAVRTESGDLVGLAPWFIEDNSLTGLTVQFMGSGHCCTDHLSILTAPGYEESAPKAIAHWLLNESQKNGESQWEWISLDGCDDADCIMTTLEHEAQQIGFTTHRQPTAGTWAVDLSNGWEEYLGRLSSHRRKQTRKLLRTLQNPAVFRFEQVRSVNEVPKFIETLRDLHQRRWESVGMLGCFANHQFGNFLENVAREAVALERCYFLTVYYKEMPIVAQYSLRSGSTMYSYQIGCEIDTDAPATGRLLNVYMLHQATELGITKVDFLRGDEPYKEIFRADHYPANRLRIVSRATMPMLRHQAWLAGNSLKQVAKKIVQRRSDVVYETSGGEA